MLCILGATCLLRRGMCMAVHGSPCFLSFSKAGQQALQSCFCSASGQIWETCCAPVPALPSAWHMRQWEIPAYTLLLIPIFATQAREPMCRHVAAIMVYCPAFCSACSQHHTT